MTALLVAVAVVAAAPEPPRVRVFNVEAAALGAAGLLCAGLGAWRVVKANEALRALNDELDRVRAGGSSVGATEARTILQNGRQLQQSGELDTAFALGMFALGGAFLVGSVVSFITEGVQREALSLTPVVTASGGGLTLQGRF